MKNIILSALLLVLAGCVANPQSNHTSSTLNVSPEVRQSSNADETLFRDILAAPGGVGFIDKVLHPNAKSSTISIIEVIAPYSGNEQGIEKWYVTHDNSDTAIYLVKLNPDGNGGTFFTITPQK